MKLLIIFLSFVYINSAISSSCDKVASSLSGDYVLMSKVSDYSLYLNIDESEDIHPEINQLALSVKGFGDLDRLITYSENGSCYLIFYNSLNSQRSSAMKILQKTDDNSLNLATDDDDYTQFVAQLVKL